MKRILPFFIFLLPVAASAQKPAAPAGYEIRVTLKPLKNQWIYLGHYYGKQLPIIDSAKLNDKSEAVFRGTKKLGGGIYLVGFPDRSRNFEVLIDKNQHFGVIADTATLQNTLRFTGSPDNQQFLAYQQEMGKAGRTVDSLIRLRTAHPEDSVHLTAAIAAINTQVQQYRDTLIKKDPNGLLSTLLVAMKEPEVPKDPAAEKADSLYAYHYYKNHYWDGINFYDERLARTPFFESRVDKYIDQLIYPAADSVIKEIDYMMSYARINKEMEKFLLLKFINRYYNQKYMWEDAVFVHLFEKYLSQKTYPWMADKGKKMIQDRAYSLMANIFGKPASDVVLPDSTGTQRSLYNVKADYTLLVIYDPTCGHCKETVPRLDSLYRKKWKAMGLQPFGLAKETDGTRKDWLDFMRKFRLDGWQNVYYSKEADKARTNNGIASYSQLFDVQSFPTLYLLDKDKRIIAKKVTEQQIDEILAVRQKSKK